MDKTAEHPKTFPLQEIPLEKLKLYPKEYQFRQGQEESGEVGSHKINGDKWEPLLHGSPIYVHKRRDKDGNWEYAVVDGHHRVNFAKRLAEQGKAPKTLQAYVLEEEKGITTETAKLMLAFKDFARGTNDVVETALAMKEAKESKNIDWSHMPDVQLDKGNLRMAYKLSGLSKESLEMVEHDEVPVEAAAMVAERVKHDTAKQDRVIKIIKAKMKQDYPNYHPNHELAQTLSSKANDNDPKSFVEALRKERNSHARTLSI